MAGGGWEIPRLAEGEGAQTSGEQRRDGIKSQEYPAAREGC